MTTEALSRTPGNIPCPRCSHTLSSYEEGAGVCDDCAPSMTAEERADAYRRLHPLPPSQKITRQDRQRALAFITAEARRTGRRTTAASLCMIEWRIGSAAFNAAVAEGVAQRNGWT